MTEGGTTVYPQITTDLTDLEFTGGLGFYHGNLMESNTGNLVLDLYTSEFDPETGGLPVKALISASTSTTVSSVTRKQPR